MWNFRPTPLSAGRVERWIPWGKAEEGEEGWVVLGVGLEEPMEIEGQEEVVGLEVGPPGEVERMLREEGEEGR